LTPPETKDLEIILQALSEKKGEDPVVLDVRAQTPYTDYMVIATGHSERQLVAMADEVEERLRKETKKKPITVEGLNHPRWILMDFDDIVVHIFAPDERGYYDLEGLWTRNDNRIPLDRFSL